MEPTPEKRRGSCGAFGRDLMGVWSLEGSSMRLFFDANELTYIAFFEGYLSEGTGGEFEAGKQAWADLQGTPPGAQVLREVEALRMLYLIDDRAHFDWLCSDIAIDEVLRIRSELKRSLHYDLLDRLIEHRQDVYTEEGRKLTIHEREYLLSRLFPNISDTMKNDAEQYCEAILVEADFFLTNDAKFIKAAGTVNAGVTPMRVGELPFIAKLLPTTEIE